jgi:hypothetical protein
VSAEGVRAARLRQQHDVASEPGSASRKPQARKSLALATTQKAQPLLKIIAATGLRGLLRIGCTRGLFGFCSFVLMPVS